MCAQNVISNFGLKCQKHIFKMKCGNSSISQHPWGARCQHDKCDAHGKSCTQILLASRGRHCRTCQSSTEKRQPPLKSRTSHTSISGPYQDHQLSLHTPHKILKNLICLPFTPFNPHINLSFLTLPPNISPPLALISKKDLFTERKK